MKWFIAVRPWSFTASLIPLSLGAILAFSQGQMHPWLFIFTLLAGVAVHAGTNYLNTYGDFISGVDTKESAPSVPELVTGTLEPKHMYWAGLGCMALAGVIGLFLAIYCGWLVLIFGGLGIIGGYTYTMGRYPYKYYGLGPCLVFILMGPLMTMPAYYIQTGQITWACTLISLPIGFLVTAIMHSNDLRDIMHDQAARIKTLALYLGFSKARTFYGLLFIGAYVSVIIMVTTSLLPLFALLPLAMLPLVFKHWQSLRDPVSCEALLALEMQAAKIHFLFGLLLITGLIFSIFLD